MTKDEIHAAILHCQQQIAFWGVEAECARDEMYYAEAEIENEESELENLQAMLDEADDE